MNDLEKKLPPPLSSKSKDKVLSPPAVVENELLSTVQKNDKKNIIFGISIVLLLLIFSTSIAFLIRNKNEIQDVDFVERIEGVSEIKNENSFTNTNKEYANIEHSKEKVDNKYYEFHELSEQPEFPGGAASMQAFITKNIIYPQFALDNNIEGTVTVQFIINKDGYVKFEKIVKDPGGGLGHEAERIINLMPKWKPGKKDNSTVPVRMMAPIRFRLKKADVEEELKNGAQVIMETIETIFPPENDEMD